MLKTFSGRRASQVAEELAAFIALLQARDVTAYLEIGARHGDTFHAVMCSLPRGSTGVAVDLGGGAWGTPKSVECLKRVRTDLRERGYNAHVIFGDSTDQDVVKSVRFHGSFDAVFIDGDHRYHGVSADWRNYGNSALVGFHDIVGTGQTDKVSGYAVEVPRVWAELKANYKHQEFVVAGSKMGIGVILR